MRLISSISSLRLLLILSSVPYATVYLAHPSVGIFNYMLSLFEFLKSPVWPVTISLTGYDSYRNIQDDWGT